MVFVEPFFLFCILPVAVAVFYLAGRLLGSTAALIVLIATSIIFYAPYGLVTGLILAGSLLCNFALGTALAAPMIASQKTRRWLLAIGLCFNFGLLAVFKYLDGLYGALMPGALPLIGFAIPAGISFYTFHQAVFLVDAEARRPDVTGLIGEALSTRQLGRNLARYVAFVGFFPQLVIGPITYMREFAPQVLAKAFGRLSLVNLQVGITLVIFGLFKKLCLADPLAAAVDQVFSALQGGHLVARPQALFAIMGYFFQLYFDFSGYSDIAVGIARLFGIRLPQNFDSPLRATGIADFYRRWHITLTRVITLFLFTPLSLWGSRFAINRNLKGWRRRAFAAWLPALVNFQVIALWHAAMKTFLLFGLAHGLWFVIESEIRSQAWFKAFRARTGTRLRFLLGLGLTTLLLMITFALFRSPSVAVFGQLMTSLFGGADAVPTAAIKGVHWRLLIGAALVVYLLPNSYDLLRRYRPAIRTFVSECTAPRALRLVWRPTLGWALLIAGLAVAVFTRLNLPTPFLYAGF